MNVQQQQQISFTFARTFQSLLATGGSRATRFTLLLFFGTVLFAISTCRALEPWMDQPPRSWIGRAIEMARSNPISRRNLSKFHERGVYKFCDWWIAVDARSFTIFGEPPVENYFRTNDALILLVSQRGFIFLELFDTGNRSRRASNASFNFSVRVRTFREDLRSIS